MPAVVWWEVETPDPEAFQSFHAAMWDWQFEPAFAGTDLGADYWIIKDGGTGIGGLQRAAGSHRPCAGVRLYVRVEELEPALRRAGELGGRIERPRTGLGGDDRWFGIVTDPAGVSFGLWTANPPAA
jgi:predicted enzyme related to lactoylglutathione lyase